MGEQWLEGWEMVVDGTPCERVIDERCLIHIPDNLVEIYGNDPDVQAVGAASYMGCRCSISMAPSSVIWRSSICGRCPMSRAPRCCFRFRRTGGAELRRMRVEAQVREREQKLGRLVGSAMDAIIEVDQHLQVTQMNPAAEKVFGCSAAEAAAGPLLIF